MSNEVFTPPSGPGAFGSWSYPIKKTPQFASIKQRPINLRNEVALSESPYPVWNFDYDFSYLKGQENIPNSSQNSGLAYLLGFFGARLGSADDWLLLYPFDSSATDEPFGYGDGVTTQFQLQRSINGLFPDIIQNPQPGITIKQAGTTLSPISASGYYIGLENLLQYSQQFDHSPWVATASGGASAPVITGAQTAPDSTSTAYQIAYPAVGAGQQSFLYQPISGVSCLGQSVALSLWLRADSATTIQMFIASSSPTFVTSYTQVVNVTTSWTRYDITARLPTIGIVGNVPYVGLLSPSGSSSTTVYAWGAQFERNVAPSDYILTTTNSVQPNGVVTFRIAPPAGNALTWSGSFWYRCRFDEDMLEDLKLNLYEIWELDSLKFHSVIKGDV